tara:strand:- start:305 stop:1027 length:723 start_codon:yes stop_codon:yes gene_type:complete
MDKESKERRRITFAEPSKSDIHYEQTYYEPSPLYKENRIRDEIGSQEQREQKREEAFNNLFKPGGFLYEKMQREENITWNRIKNELKEKLRDSFSLEVQKMYSDDLERLYNTENMLENELKQQEEKKEKLNIAITNLQKQKNRISRRINDTENNVRNFIEREKEIFELRENEKRIIQNKLRDYANRNNASGEGEKKVGGRKKKTRRMKKKNKRKTRRRKKRKKTRRKKGGIRKTRRCVKL